MKLCILFTLPGNSLQLGASDLTDYIETYLHKIQTKVVAYFVACFLSEYYGAQDTVHIIALQYINNTL